MAMISIDFSIEFADWSNAHDRDALRHVREQVYIIEQCIPPEEEWDVLDAASRHVLARDGAGQPIGTGRLTPTHVIGRMAVLKDWRGKGVGAAILRTLIERARELNYPVLEMNAQTHAIPFYAAFGFQPVGAEFIECAIAHRKMQLELTRDAPPDRPGSQAGPLPQPRIVAIESREQALTETLALINDAKRELWIYTRDLDPALFDTEPGLDALKRVAIAGRGASIQILVSQPQAPVKRGHRLIELAQRLSSVFAFRTPVQETDLQYPSAFVLNDRRGYYFRTLGSRYEGELVTYAPGRHAQLREYFGQVWERSEPSEELRLLAL